MPLAATSIAACVLYAASHYGVPPVLLSSVVVSEGGGRGVVRRNANGSEDLGWAQINTFWLKRLQRYGIRRQTLLRRPCVNIGVSAWILRGDYLRCRTWPGALSAYNSGRCRSDPGERYARRVLRRYWRTLESTTPPERAELEGNRELG